MRSFRPGLFTLALLLASVAAQAQPAGSPAGSPVGSSSGSPLGLSTGHLAGEHAADGPGPVRGVVKPLGEALIASDLGRRILEMPWRDGQRFRKGDLLVRFDCDELRAEAKAAAAVHRGKKAAHANAVELNRLQAAGSLSVAMAAAEADKTEADVAVFEAKIRHCAILAPFDGRAVERLASPFETPGVSQPVLRILNDTDLEIQLVVPSRWLRWLKEGMAFAFEIDETGETVKARIRRIGAGVDPVSQTVRLAGEFQLPSPGILSGMSGTAIFEPPPATKTP